MQTRDQKYAEKAHQYTCDIKEEGKEGEKYRSYGAMAHKLPILIRTAGLAQALAFVEARSNDLQKKILDHLADTIGKENRGILLAAARTARLPEYMLLTRQVLAALLWYKRFAQSILHVENGANADTEGKP